MRSQIYLLPASGGIKPAYIDKARALIRRTRLAQAGVRLASLLNETLRRQQLLNHGGQRVSTCAKNRTMKMILLLTAFLMAPVHFRETQAQQPASLHRVGRLTGGSPDDPLSKESFEAFRLGLRDLGWIEGQNLASLDRRQTGELA